jgi:ribosomal protein L7/L12
MSMKFFRVSAINNAVLDYTQSFFFQIDPAIRQLRSHHAAGHIDVGLEECMTFGEDPYIPDHTYDCHHIPLYVVKCGDEHERVHYCFDLPHLRDVLGIVEEDRAKNVVIETHTVQHWLEQKPVVVPPKKAEPTMTLGELLRKKLDETKVSDDKEWAREAVRFIKDGNKVGAIKIVRTTFGLGLKESKDVVDAYCDWSRGLWGPFDNLTLNQKDIVRVMDSIAD